MIYLAISVLTYLILGHTSYVLRMGNIQTVFTCVSRMFYQAVVASVLLYGRESWVLPPSAY